MWLLIANVRRGRGYHKNFPTNLQQTVSKPKRRDVCELYNFSIAFFYGVVRGDLPTFTYECRHEENSLVEKIYPARFC